MGLFIKKRVIVEAIQFDGSLACAVKIEDAFWPNVVITYDSLANAHTGQFILLIETLEGPITARAGDWIIKGLKGEVYPCKPDIFAESYETVP